MEELPERVSEYPQQEFLKESPVDNAGCIPKRFCPESSLEFSQYFILGFLQEIQKFFWKFPGVSSRSSLGVPSKKPPEVPPKFPPGVPTENIPKVLSGNPPDVPSENPLGVSCGYPTEAPLGILQEFILDIT